MLDHNGRVQALALNCRSTAELTGGDLDVVVLKRQDNIFHGQLIIGQLVGIDPDPDGILGTEIFDFTHPRYPGQDFFQIGLGIIPQIQAVHAAVLGDQPHNHHIIFGGFADLDPLSLDHIGQAGHGKLQLVLYFGPGEIRIGPRSKGQLNAG
ncbi:hypothetical protein DESC_970083 [Desulfosarcina cetonica]|nr:hypothetical protein DESC_970083 [Desulfosarcina cetonica]